MKKAFTLVEVLAVIVILGILAAIVIPVTNNIIKDSRERGYIEQVGRLEELAYTYIVKENITANEGIITFDDLINSGLLSEYPLDPRNSEPLEGYFTYKWNDNTNQYDIDLFEPEPVDPNAELTLELEPVGFTTTDENAWLNHYVDVNVIRTTNDYYKYCVGSENCEPTTTSRSGVISVKTEGAGQYVCAYGTRDSQKTPTECVGPINIDTVAPNLEGIIDVSIGLNEPIDLMDGITASDATSGIKGVIGVIPASIDTSIANKTHTVEYAVEDNAGNLRTVTRRVLVDVPSPTIIFSPNGGSRWSAKNITVNISATDDSQVGIQEVKWCITTSDTCTPTNQSSNIAVIMYESGNNKICATATNKAGQTTELMCSAAFKIDKQTPFISPNSETIVLDKGLSVSPATFFNVTYGVSGGKVTCNVGSTALLEIGSHSVTCTATGENGLSSSASKNIEIQQSLNVAIGTGMIPVEISDAGVVTVANTNAEWYNYLESKWANAVTVSNVYGSYRTAAPGTEIPVDHIDQMYVYIPRYRYQVFSSPTPITIQVEFESKYNPKSTGTSAGQWLTHPAFSYIEEDGTIVELDGFWVGKFEQGETHRIVPNTNSIHYLNISQIYNGIISKNGQNGLVANETDIHMIINMEWGAIAYLSQSVYGICESTSTCGLKVENNNYYSSEGLDIATGCGGAGTENPILSSDVDICPSDNRWNTANGVKSSTTHNITGVYDMAGGRYETVMYNSGYGNYFYSSDAGFSEQPSTKYWDDSDTWWKPGPGVISEISANWNGDPQYGTSRYYTWIYRGGYTESVAGIFAYYNYTGRAETSVTSRSTMWIN